MLKIEPRDWQTMADKRRVRQNKEVRRGPARPSVRPARCAEEVEALWKAVQVVVLKHAQIELAAGDYQAAVGVCTEANRLEPADVRPLILRGGVHDQLDEGEKAMADLDRARKLKPDSSEVMRLLTALLVQAGRTGKAIDQIEEYLKNQPGDIETRIRLASLYSLNRKHDKAIEVLSKIIAKDPKNWEAFRSRGNVYLTTGRHAEAIADFEKAYRLNPHDSGLLNNFAWVLATSPVNKLRDGKRGPTRRRGVQADRLHAGSHPQHARRGLRRVRRFQNGNEMVGESHRRRQRGATE